MHIKLKNFYVLFFILLMVLFLPGTCQVFGDELDAISRVSQAEDSLEAAYITVVKAERAGVDVSELVGVLNTAMEYYNEAERAIKTGHYEEAVLLATKVIRTSNIVLDADISLMVVAEHVEETTFRNQLFLSSGAVLIIILFGILGWRYFKSYYIHRMMGLKIEVNANESR